MNRDETRAYSRGYQRGYKAGFQRGWPEYRPPIPPDPMAAEIIKAAVALADHVANWCGAFGEGDEFSVEMRPLLDAVDAANSKVTEWATSPDSAASNGTEK